MFLRVTWCLSPIRDVLTQVQVPLGKMKKISWIKHCFHIKKILSLLVHIYKSLYFLQLHTMLQELMCATSTYCIGVGDVIFVAISTFMYPPGSYQLGVECKWIHKHCFWLGNKDKSLEKDGDRTLPSVYGWTADWVGTSG